MFTHADRELTQIVGISVEQTLGVSSVSIISGDISSPTVRASVGGLLFPDTNYSLQYSPAANTWTALKNGNAIGAGLSWTDTGGVINHTAEYRYGGIFIEYTGLNLGGKIDNWFLRDWAA